MRRFEPKRHASVILIAANDLAERPGTGRVAGVRSFAALGTTVVEG
jgi:hypothetical protein